MNVNIYYTKAYSNETAFRWGKNKPNSNPIQSQTNPIRQEPKMNVNVAFTRNYHNNPALPGDKNKPNSKPILQKAQMNANSLLIKDYESQPRSGSKSNSKPILQKAQMNANSLLIKDYESQPRSWSKSNSKPILQKAQMNATLIAKRDYENQPLRSLPENKPSLKVARFAVVMMLAQAMCSPAQPQDTDNLAFAAVMCKLSTLGSIAKN